MAKDFNKPRYFVQIKDTTPVELTEKEFMQAEQSAGFRSKFPGRPATGGFSGGPFVSYKVRYDELTEDVS